MQIKTKLLPAAAVALAVFTFQAAAQTQISSISDFEREIEKNPGGNFALARNIDAGELPTNVPVGSYGGARFTGTLDGKGYTIYNLRINGSGGYVGLFAYVGKGAVIKNLGVIGNVSGEFAVGILAGGSEGTIQNCHVQGTVTAKRQGDSNAGGLVGINGGVIRRSFSEAAVSGGDNVGGLVGMLTTTAKGARIEDSYAAKGTVRGRNYVGGLAGYVFGGEITQCIAVSGTVTGSGNAGGLIGYDYGAANSGNKVYGRTGSGAIARAAAVAGSFWNTQTTGQRNSAGAVGKNVAEGIDNAAMQNRATYQSWGASRYDVWNIDSMSGGYPRLQGMPAVLDPDDPGGGVPAATYTLAAGVTPAGGGSVRRDPSKDKYAEGEAVKVTAVPAGDYEFSGWLERAGDLSNPVTVTMSKDESLTAVFVLKGDTSGSGVTMYALTVSAEPPEGGDVSRWPNKDKYDAGESVVLSAMPKAGYEFTGWRGRDDLLRDTATIVMNGDLALVAVFKLKDTGGEDPLPGLYINGDLADQVTVPLGSGVTVTVVADVPDRQEFTYRLRQSYLIFGTTMVDDEVPVQESAGGKEMSFVLDNVPAGTSYYFVEVLGGGGGVVARYPAENYFTIDVVAPSPGSGLEKKPAAAAFGAKVRGRNLIVTAPQPSAAVVRLIDMKGRTVASFRTAGSAAVPLARVPAGRYMLEARSGGKVISASPVIIK